MPMSEYYKRLRQKIGRLCILNPSVAAIIRNDKGEILFQQPSLDSDIWSLPAGAIELGESPSEAIIREVYEETGLHVVPQKLLGVLGGEKFRFTYPDGNEVEYLILVFECRDQSGTITPIDGESQSLRYFEYSSIPKLAIPYPKEIFRVPQHKGTLFN